MGGEGGGRANLVWGQLVIRGGGTSSDKGERLFVVNVSFDGGRKSIVFLSHSQ